jgi:GT2 family glycosyltransferase
VKAAARRWHGELEGIDAGLLYGWCIDTQQPDARVVVEISVDWEPVGTVVADVVRADLLARFEKLGGKGVDACHGFVADLRVLAGDATGALSARVANSREPLPGRVSIEDAPAPPDAAGSYVFSDGGLRLHGWCKPRETQLGATIVRAFAGAKEVARTRADQIHPTMRHFGVERDGFVIDLPPQLADGRTHTVRVVDENGAELNGSPVTVCCFPAGARALLKEPNALLESVIDSYERFLPRSLGMDYYPAWREEFESHWMPDQARHDNDKAVVAGRKVVIAALTRNPASLKVALITPTPITPQLAAKVTLHPDFRTALASNPAILGFIRPGDDLREHAIAATLEAFGSKETLVAYTDSEFQNRPWFKPAWNPDYAFVSDYPLELMLVRADFARKYSPVAASPDAAALQWHWLAAAHATSAKAIVHVPRALYIWNSAPSAGERAARAQAAAAALARLDPTSQLQALAATAPLFAPRRIVRRLSPTERSTPVTLIIPTRDRPELLERCLASIRKHTDWRALEIIVVDNDSTEPATHQLLAAARKQGVRVRDYPGPFNFSAMNNRAVEAAQGSIIGLINNDIEALHHGWLDEIVGHLLRPGVGAVGPKLIWPNGMVQHGGVLLGVGNAAGHFGNRLADADWGDHGRNQLAQQVSAVTAACLFLRKQDYLDVGGMDETAFPVTFNDVDLCLKLRARGQSIVWTPFARLLHAESASRGKEDAPPQRSRAQRELDSLREKWGSALLRDPAYHPSLNLDAHSHAFGGLALPPRDRRPRTGDLPR